ncbi:unnamed protein product [Cunninghamella blakesleeana]
MGNQQSQPILSTTLTNHLSSKAKKHLSENKYGQQPINNKNQTLVSSSTSSKTSTTNSYTTQLSTLNGRKYLDTSQYSYFLPCDEDEIDRLIVLHYLLKYTLNANFTAPIKDLLQNKTYRPKVLDVGTGCGSWILEMAVDFPNADFYGIDIADMYPTTIKPSNTYFQQHDILQGLPFENETFDYVFMRQMTICTTKSELIQLLEEICRVLKPNGYIEIIDAEYKIQRPGPVSYKLINEHLIDILKTSYGIENDLSTQLTTLLMTTQTNQGEGFIDIRQQRVTIPLGWGGKLGELHGQNLSLYLKSINPSITKPKKESTPLSTTWSPPGIEHKTTVLSEAAIQHTLMECKKYQSHLNWYTCYAKKSSILPSTPNKPNHTMNNMNNNNGFLSSPSSTSSSSHSSFNSISSNSMIRYDPISTSPKYLASTMDVVEWDSINSFVTGFVE